MGNLTMTKTWHDEVEAFCEIEVFAVSDLVSARGNYYVSNDELSELSQKLKAFLNLQIQSFEWQTGKRGPGYTPDFEISAEYTNIAKHIRFNIFMGLEDIKLNKLEGITPNKNYSCSFYIDDLENGKLYEFLKKLSSFDIGKTISVY